ncbi:MAG: hypothetical protein ABSG93_16565 [Solirubrobacteraceae bacterium]|jgi:hypothetical protein
MVLSLCAASLLLTVAVSARADVFGPISLVSDEDVLVGGQCESCEQAGYAHDPAISGNAEYVAFDGYFDGQTGVWRRDLRTGEVDPVAVGAPGTPAGSAELPSISETGQYISFTTRAALSPDDTNLGPDVYVRNMDLKPTQGGAFVLASAVNGSTQGLTYAYPQHEQREEEDYGAMAAGRSALTANGEEVVFVTTAASDLEGEATPETPPLEVAVRNMRTHATKLVSVEYDPATGRPVIGAGGRPEPVPMRTEGSKVYGAVYTSGGIPIFRLPEPYHLAAQVPASISADGSAVAWQAQDVGEQAPTLSGESLLPQYSEPLWRRIEEGEEDPTRRVTGGSDPTDKACIASGEPALPTEPSPAGPCQGPFRTNTAFGTWDGVEDDVVPRLSEDGEKVAFIADTPLVSLGNDFGLGPGEGSSDLYVADMQEGLSRVQALTPLTEQASGQGEIAPSGPIMDFAISPGGTEVAFTTQRTIFPLGSPAFVSAPAAVPGLDELFDVDLTNDTLTRVTHGYEGGASEHPHAPSRNEDEYIRPADGALSPSFSKDGDYLAFSSTASNLVFGDGNTPPLGRETGGDGSDVFVAQREQFNFASAPQVISPAPPSPPLAPQRQLWATAASLENGSVRLYVEVPGAGTLHAVASGAVAVRSAHSARSDRRANRGKAASGHARIAILDRDVATTTLAAGADAGGVVPLTLTLAPSYRSLAARSGGFTANVSIAFTAPGQPALHTSIAVSFVRKAARSSHAKASSRSKARGRTSR